MWPGDDETVTVNTAAYFMIFVFADMTETAVEAPQEVKPTKEVKESGEAGAEGDREKRER